MSGSERVIGEIMYAAFAGIITVSDSSTTLLPSEFEWKPTFS